MTTVVATQIRTARTPRVCGECGREVAKGRSYEHSFSVVDGEATFASTCMVCVNGRAPMHCGDDLGHGEQLRRETAAAAER